MSVIINGDTGIATPGVTDTGTLSVTGVTTLDELKALSA